MKNWFGFVATALSVCAMPSLAAFSESSFNYGVMWEGAKKLSDFTGLSHIAMYAGDGSRDVYNPYWEGEMLRKCKEKGLTPVFYAYIIAEWDKHYGRSDCDVGSPNHCTHGADLIRNHWDEIIGRYKDLANGVKNDYGTSGTSIWLIEPDFFQYSVSGDAREGRFDQVGGGIPDKDLAGKYFNDIVAAIKGILPNAKIGVDISPWLNEGLKSWYDNFDKSKVDYLFNSGGRTQGDQSRIRNDNNNMLTWAQASSYMDGKKIIADDGYGVGGGAENNYGEWLVRSNLNARIADGVIGLTLKDPGNDFYTFAKNNPIALSGSTNPSSSSSYSRSSSSQWQGGISSPWQGGISSPIQISSSSQGSSGGTSFALTTANLIDDFEDGDSTAYTGANDTWFAFTDVGDKGASSLSNTKNATGYNVVFAADNGSKYMAGLKGITLSQGSNPYDPYVTLGLDINGGLKGCKTISYKYKGAAHNLKAVTKGDEMGALSEYNYHKAAVSGSNSWQAKTLALSALTQEAGWGKTFALSASNVVKLQWEVKGIASTNSLYVDDVACDGMSIVRPASSSSSAKSSSSVASSSSTRSSSSVASSSSVSSSSVVSSSSASLEWTGNAQLSNTSATGVDIGQSNGYSPDRVISKSVAVTAGETNVLTFKMKLSGQGPLDISTNIESCSVQTSVNTSAVNVSCNFSPKSNMSTLTLTVPGGTWQTVTVSDLSVSVKGTPVITVFNPAAANTTQKVVAGQAITPIVYHFENVKSVSVEGLPKGLNGVVDNAAKTFTISGTVDATLTDHDYAYTVTVTGVDENTTATGTIKVAHKPVAPVFTVASEASLNQEVVAGSAIEPIVFSYANVKSISADNLPLLLNTVLDQDAKTYTIQGVIDVSLTDKDYEYVVNVTGIDSDTIVRGTIKVAHKPVITVFNPAAANTTQEVVAGQAITPIVYHFENVKSVSVEGLPKGLNGVVDNAAKTFTISGTIDASLTDHDYAYTVTVTGVDENTTATGTIKVAHKPVVTTIALTSANANQEVFAGMAIEPIVFRYENVREISVEGLPQGLSGSNDQLAGTYVISGIVDEKLTTRNYGYEVIFLGVDENQSASGIISVKEHVIEISSSSEASQQSSSSVEPEVSSSSEASQQSSSSVEPEVSSSSAAPQQSSSSVVPEISSSSEAPLQSSSSEEPVVSSSSEEQVEDSSSSSEEPDSSSSYDDITRFANAKFSSFNMNFACNTLVLNTSKTESLGIQIFDVMGHVVASSRELVSGSFSMNLDYLNRGSYLVRVSSGGEVRSSRIAIR